MRSRRRRSASRTPREERIIAGFEEIQRYVDQHGRVPQHGEDHDIFERLYAVRLDRLRDLADCRAVIGPLDRQGLLTGPAPTSISTPDDLDDDELLAQLGADAETGDITQLRHVRSAAEKRAADEIANRQPCEDFDGFRPLFDKVQQEIENGLGKRGRLNLKPRSSPGAGSFLAGRRLMWPHRARCSRTLRGGPTHGCG